MCDQQDVDPKKVRPILMGEFLRVCVSRRLLALSEGEIAALTTSMRQIGVGTAGGAWALSTFHQLLYDEWMTGSLSGPLARIKVDEKFCFGMSRCASRRRGFSEAHQQQRGNAGTCPLSNKKGSRQCPRIEGRSRETLMAPGVQPGSGHGGSGGARKHCRPVQKNSDFKRTTRPGCTNRQTSSLVRRKSSLNEMDAAPPEWRIGDVRSVAKTSAVTDGSITLGVAVGCRQFITDQLLSKAGVIRAMQERVQLCQDPQTEVSLLRESLGVSRINHILRVHGHTILEEQSEAAVHNETGQRSFDRLFTRMTQATLSASQSGIGFKRAQDIGSFGTLIAAKPCIQGMIRDAVLAGLLPEQLLETRLSGVTETATDSTAVHPKSRAGSGRVLATH